MKKIKTIILIIILIVLATITTVNASDNSTDLISQTQSDEFLQSNDEYINNNQNLEFKLNVSDTADYDTTGNLTFNVYFNGKLSFGPTLYDFEKNPITIYKNNQKIGNIPVNQINYTTFKQGTYNIFNATFTQHIEDKTQIKLHYTIWDSNTIIIQKQTTPTLTPLNNKSIQIINENIINSNNSWNNSIDYLRKSIELAKNNAEIRLNNIYIQATPIYTDSTRAETTTINKNLKITGNNATINTNENSRLFKINSNTTFQNITFTNASSYIFINNGNLTFINCTFTDSYGRIINNTGKLNIINSTFKDMKAFYKNTQISTLNEYYQEIGLIYNTGTLTINNTKFDNFEYPKEIKIDNYTIKELGIIYNLNNATITSSNFTNINSRAINNTGTLKIENSLFKNITTNTLKIVIDSKDFKKIGNSIIHQSYNGFRQQSTGQTITNPNYFINGGGIYNNGNLNISKSQFNNIESYYGGAIYNEKNMNIKNSRFTSTTSSGGMGGAICNNNNMIIENTIINNSKTNLLIISELNPSGSIKYHIVQSHGGAIYNKQTLTINNSTITQSSARYGGAITNNGILRINNTTFDKNQITENGQSPTLFNDEDGDCEIYDSIIKNTNIKTSEIGGGGAFRLYMGTISNMGKLYITKSIFDNISGIYEPLTQFTGTYTILNYGTLNATYNYFINSPHKVNPDKDLFYDLDVKDVYTYAFTAVSDNNHMNNNYYCLNSDPYTIDTNFPVEDYFILTFENEYCAVDLNENKNITLKLKLASGKEFNNYELLPNIPVTINTYDKNGNPINITTSLNNGKITIPYNYTSTKGSYIISAEMGGGKCNTTIDVGKANATMNITKNNIYYTQNAVFKINITAPTTPTGNITLKLNNTKYTEKLNENGNCIFNISKPEVGNYTLQIIYEGDDDYFKIFYYDNYTVSKCPTNMTMSIPEVYYGNNGIITVKFNPTDITVYTYLYINGEYDRQKIIKGSTTITLKNFAAGNYNLTLYYNGDENYESSNATAIFKVKKYETYLTINTTDINAGENQTLEITLTPKGEVEGEANLTINNHTEIIYLKNGKNNITINNVAGGAYNVTVTFPGDKKYSPSSATAKFTARKLQSNITAKIENDILYINATPKTTGLVLIYINDDIYNVNLTNSQIIFPVNFTKAENYIFIYYQGDQNYNYSTYNLTYEYEKLLNLTGYDETFYTTQNASYYVTLTDEEGYGIANKSITITINGKTYEKITGYDGSILLNINLNAGNYTASAKYKNKTTTNTIRIIEDAFISTSNTNAYENINFIYMIELKDHKNNGIANGKITVKANGQTYTTKTDSNGRANITLNLPEGRFNITTSYKSVNSINTINIKKLTLTGEDLTFYNSENTTYHITLTDDDKNGIPNETITIKLNNKTYRTITDKNGIATQKICLDTGKYTLTAIYKNKTLTNTITVIEDAFLTTKNVKAHENIDFKFHATLKDHNGNPIKDKEIKFTIKNSTYNAKTDNNGQATITLNFPKGNYEITTTYKEIKLKNNITISDVLLIGEDLTFYNTQTKTYHLTLIDKEDKGIANETIIVTLNNKKYTLITDKNGNTSLKIKLNPGKYIITAQHNNQTEINTITVIEDAFITSNDIKAFDDVEFTFQATLKDHNGNPITNTEIKFTIENNTYTSKTNSNGQGTIKLNLNKGNYKITTTYNTVNATNNIKVSDLKLTSQDLIVYNSENTTFNVSLTDNEGDGPENEVITIILNNVTYSVRTNENGIATKIMQLDTGNYTITTIYKNKTNINKITVLEDAFLNANNTKAYENVDFPYIVLLTDHNNKALTNKEITFIFDGKTYKNTTNNNGIAVLNLNLNEGNYTIKASYKSKNVANKIIIIDDSHLVGNDVKAYSGTNFTYRTKLTDHNNKPLTNALITFKINGKTFTNITNSNGQSTLIFNLETGNYTITATYKKLTIKNNFEIIEDYILAGNDVKAYAESNFQYKVNLTDHNGKAIQNTEITFKIDGKTYTNKTNKNGQAIINLNLKLGNHTIKVTYRNTSTTNNLEMIEDYILTGTDIKAYAESNFQYKVNLTDHNEKAIKNAEITFKIDGKIYTNTTDNNGQATITLNLKEGNYTITTTYKNTTTTNDLEIIENHILIGQNIRAFENTDFKYTVTLKRIDETPIPDKEITFIINNRRYTATTDKNGQATKTLNLPEGNYTITSIYKNTAITNNITIIEIYNLTANNVKTYAESNFQYKVNLKDHNGNGVKNVEIKFEIDGKTYTNTTNENGQTKITLNLKKGNYTITATYKNVKITNKLEIIETYLITGTNIKSYENFNFEYIVTLKNHSNKTIQNQKITFKVDGKTYTNTTNQNGQTKITLNLKKGNYTITATYQNITTTNKLEIIAYDLEQIESQDLEMYYKDGSRFTIRLTENNKPLTNKTVTFKINGASYTRTTNNDGYAGIAINLNSGKHNITTQYNNLTKQNTITIKTTITGNNITKIFRNDTQYYATFYNQKGEPLKNTPIYFNINGVFYTRTTNNNGTAKLNINLNPGKYIITATNPETTEQHSNTITVLSKIQENNDLTKYYKNESQYIVKIIKSNGQTAGAGEKVTFNINGVFYTRTTNETGHVKMNINLQPGTYIITAEYEGCQASNNIKVLPTIQAQDLTKKYRTTNPFEAKLLDKQGKPQANEKVTFNINGVFYTRTTNNNGTAKLNINLQPGTYIITSQYNDAITSNTIKITP